jgi:glutaredoxin
VTEVLLLTKEDCSFCDQAKKTLLRLGDDFELSVREVPLDSAEGAELSRAAVAPFPPVVFVNGKPFSYGRLSERKLRKALVAESD